eukprot:3698121-Rhodomonas_salina.1
MDSERMQLANQLSNQQEENAELRDKTRELEERLEEMASKGIEYVSAGESDGPSDDDFDAGKDVCPRPRPAVCAEA